MDNTNGISVIIPTKNRANRIKDCIKSILCQTHSPDEIIIVDDHSTDDTYSVIQSFKENKLKYILNERAPGAQGARNQGIIIAKNKWIAFQDSDDYWMPNKLETQYSILKKNNFDTNFVIHSAGYKLIPEKKERVKILQDIFDGYCYEKLLIKQGPLFPTLLTSKNSLTEIGLLDEFCPSYQEWDTSIRLAKKNRFIYINQPLFEWVCHNDETISKNLKNDVRGHLYVLNKNKMEIINSYGSKIWYSLIIDLIYKARNYDLINEVENEIEELPNMTKKLLKFLIKKNRRLPMSRILIQLSNKLF